MKTLFLTASLISLFAASNASAHDVSQSNEAVVKQIYADFAVGDMQGFMEALSPDVVWNEAENNPYVTESPYIGIDAVMNDAMSVIGTDFSSFAVAPERYLVDGDTVAMFGRYKATYKATGNSMTPQVVHLWTLEDGHITGFQQYGDTAAMRDVMVQDLSEKELGEKLLAEYVTALNSNDVDTLMGMVTDDVVYQYSGANGEIVGKSDVREWDTEFFNAYEAEFDKESQEFHVSGDLAAQRYIYSYSLTEKATGNESSGDGKGIIVYRKSKDGKWLLAWDGWSDNPRAEK